MEVGVSMGSSAGAKQSGGALGYGPKAGSPGLDSPALSAGNPTPVLPSEGVNRLLIGLIPVVFIVLLVMRQWGYIAVEPLWVYALIFGCAAGFYVILELHVVATPSPFRLNLQIAVAAATTTAIMYVTGWGPAIIAGYSTAA